MIINLIEEKTNQIKSNYKDEGNIILDNPSFSTKTLADILTWKVYNSKINLSYFTVISNSISFLHNINYNLPAFLTLNNYKIETSIDYINWYELPIKDTWIPEKGINDPLKEPTKYIFYLNDIYGNSTYLYKNYEFQMIRFTFFNLNKIINDFNRLKFNNLEILIDEQFNSTYIKKNLLTVRSSMFTKPKIYNEYPFLPDMITSFMKMLETNNSYGMAYEYKSTYLQKTNFDINYVTK
jgi:hypothetical protein